MKQQTNRLGRCYQPERPFCALARYTLRRKGLPFTYMLSAQVSGRKTCVYAGSWHAGHRRRSAAARLLRLWVRIPPRDMDVIQLWVLCVLSGRGLCDELIIRPEESYRLWWVVLCDLETSWMRRPWPTGDCRNKNEKRGDGKFGTSGIFLDHVSYVTVTFTLYSSITSKYDFLC